MAANRILVLFGHPAVRKSRVNRRMAEAAASIPGVTLRDLYELYPDFVIDVDVEKKQLLAHDIIVFQHPFYWYSTPAIFKEWFDLVLEYGFAYGPGGTALHGKSWLTAITAGGQKQSYCSEGHNAFSIRELLAPMEQTATLCGMQFLEPHVTYGVHQLDSKTEIPAAVEAYVRRLESLKTLQSTPEVSRAR